MVNIKDNKGITILSTVIMIIVLLILTSTIIVAGTNSLENMKIEKFKSELSIIEKKSNVIAEKIKAGNTNFNNAGIDLSNLNSDASAKLTTIFNGQSTDGFKYYNESELEKLDITGIKNPVLINLSSGQVISFNGYEIDGVTYYTLDSIEHMNDNK